jgi:hypothetical protein
MVWYEYPSNWSNGTQSVNGLGNFFQYISAVTNNWLAVGFLLIIWIFTFFLSMVSGSRKALLTSSFITFIFSVYFVRLGMINLTIVFVFVILTIIGAISSYNENSL